MKDGISLYKSSNRIAPGNNTVPFPEISAPLIFVGAVTCCYGQNAFFYDAAEGLLTAVILLLAEYLPPTDKAPQERRHIVSVFKLVQDLLAPSKTKGKTSFHILMDKLPDTHKARWFAGAALNTAEQSASVHFEF